MCIAIYKLEDTVLTKEGLERCWRNNPDGGGVSYAEDGRIRVFKTMDQDEWVNYIMANMDRELVIHARYTTKGLTNVSNCHPYYVGKEAVCFMNGTMAHLPTEKVRSDTRIFCEDIMTQLPHGWRDSSSVVELIRHYAGSAKLIFMHDDGRVDILNEALGDWSEGAWFSNEWYEEERYGVPMTGKATGMWIDEPDVDDYGQPGWYQRYTGADYTQYERHCQACDIELETEAEEQEMLCEECSGYLSDSLGYEETKCIQEMSDKELDDYMMEMT